MVKRSNDPTKKCTCTLCGPSSRKYTCKGCKRFVRFCFGASDDMPGHCDDCWAKAHPEVSDAA